MDLDIRGMGIIFDIEPSKFIADGAFYINEDYFEKEQQSKTISLLSSSIKDMFFDNKVNKIIEEATNNTTEKTVAYRNQEIENFFEEKNGRMLDIIFFADIGFRGTDTVNMEENSIIYFKISENIKFGFFINKIMAQIIFGGINNG